MSAWADFTQDDDGAARNPPMSSLLPSSLREVWADPPTGVSPGPTFSPGRRLGRPPPRPPPAIPDSKSAPLNRDFDQSLTFQGEIDLSGSSGISQQLYTVEFNPNRSTLFHAQPRVRVNVGDWVLTEADRGFDVGRVVGIVARPSPRDATRAKAIVRGATDGEVAQLEQKSEREARALEVCRSKTAELGLPMAITHAEFQFDGKKLTFYYTAASYVDFRDLVRLLFKVFGTRIWMVWCNGGQE
jgi:hypothetical protein